MRWNLNSIYKGFDDPQYAEDMKRLEARISTFVQWIQETWNKDADIDPVPAIEVYIGHRTFISSLASRTIQFASLAYSVDVTNPQAPTYMETIRKMLSRMSGPSTKFVEWLRDHVSIDECVKQSELIADHQFYLEEIQQNARYMLSESEESLISQLKTTGSNAWTSLYGSVISNHMVLADLYGEEKKYPLADIRNKAFTGDPEIRRKAWEAEVASYPEIADVVAKSLNAIKGESLTFAERRGYDSVLDQTLIQNRITRQELDAMLNAIRESLPVFRRFMKKKGEILGCEKGLRYYDLFAPVGVHDMKFTYEEAREFIVRYFGDFSPELSALASRAFDEEWIDAEPRKGKRGGAFCATIHAVGESRILTNYSNSMNSVSTLAHELGHAFHGACLRDLSILNTYYPKTLGETASIFCETLISQSAYREANREEGLTILERRASSATHVIVDIYSRFLFEASMLDRRKEQLLTPDELCDLMSKAQIEAFGDGLDPEYLHPWMWINKPHYYNAGANFYNYPYAFGQLFSTGLYAMYVEQGKEFVPIFKELLRQTGRKPAGQVAASVGIDISDKAFWRKSLSIIEDEINTLLQIM